jgi:hypothetical protein
VLFKKASGINPQKLFVVDHNGQWRRIHPAQRDIGTKVSQNVPIQLLLEDRSIIRAGSRATASRRRPPAWRSRHSSRWSFPQCAGLLRRGNRRWPESRRRRTTLPTRH